MNKEFRSVVTSLAKEIPCPDGAGNGTGYFDPCQEMKFGEPVHFTDPNNRMVLVIPTDDAHPNIVVFERYTDRDLVIFMADFVRYKHSARGALSSFDAGRLLDNSPVDATRLLLLGHSLEETVRQCGGKEAEDITEVFLR